MLHPKSFYLIRHGQTVANEQKVLCGGRVDTPLTELGRQQAEDVAKVVHTLDIKPSRIYHSSLSRARDTARILNSSLELDMTEIHNLREQEFGDWEHKPWHDALQLFGFDMQPPNGENNQVFTKRIIQTINTVMETHPEDEAPPLFVAHGGLFHAFFHAYNYYDENMWFQNCHLHKFTPASVQPQCPWSIKAYDVSESILKERVADYCPTQLNFKGKRIA